MVKKRKRGQTKQNWSCTTSRKQKKRRKTRGYGFNQAKVPDHESRAKLSNTMDCDVLQLKAEKFSSSSSVCNMLFNSWSNVRLRVRGISAIFSRLNNCADLFQRSTVRCFRSIKNLFLFLNWLKQIFGCGLQTLGKVSWKWTCIVLSNLSLCILVISLFCLFTCYKCIFKCS